MSLQARYGCVARVIGGDVLLSSQPQVYSAHASLLRLNRFPDAIISDWDWFYLLLQ